MAIYEVELRYLQAGLEQLEAYLLAKDLYWPPGVSAPAGHPPYPQLTLGNLLLARQRLLSLARSPVHQMELQRLTAVLEQRRTRWRVAWTNKARQEFSSRLRLWRDFLEEYRELPSAHQDRFRYEINRRVLLELLQPEIEGLSQAELELLQALDKVLRAQTRPGPFCWGDELQEGFPPDRFWFLYATLT